LDAGGNGAGIFMKNKKRGFWYYLIGALIIAGMAGLFALKEIFIYHHGASGAFKSIEGSILVIFVTTIVLLIWNAFKPIK